MSAAATPHESPIHIAQGTIYDALKVLIQPDNVFELRLPGTRKGTQSGYFDDLHKAAQATARLSGQEGIESIYITLNPVNPELKARAYNRVKEYAKSTTSDADILRRLWLYIDCDPMRPAGISATDDEKQAALQRARAVKHFLQSLGFPDPVIGDSGNGGHLLYRVDLSNTPDSTHLIDKCLKALDLRFSDASVVIDQTTFNAARICKLYGTMACKGDSLPERPHREARLLSIPDALEITSKDALEHLASMVPSEPERPSSNGHSPYTGREFDLSTWIGTNNLPVAREGVWQANGHKWILNPCPWNSGHTDNSAYITQHATGAISAGCHHNGCKGKGWSDLRALYDKPRHQERTYTNRRNNGSGYTEQPDGRIPGLVLLADVVPERVKWLWPGRIALGKLNIVDGDPGLGKSVITMDLGARISRAWPMPDGSIGDITEPCGVVYLSAEDGLADTIRPRLDAAGADVTRIAALTGVTEPDGSLRVPTIADLAAIEAAIAAVQAVAVFIDPITSYIPDKVETKSDHHVRRSLKPLADLAERTGAAVIVLRHLNKTPGGNPLYRGGGSIAFIGAARSGLLVAKDPNDETGNRHILAMTKSNIAKPMPALAYHLEGTENDAVRVVWDGASEHTAASILHAMEPEERSALSEAMEFLKSELADGEQRVPGVEAAAKRAGISLMTLTRARKRMGLKAQRRGRLGADGYWVWNLPVSNKHESEVPPQEEPTYQASTKPESAADRQPIAEWVIA